MHRITITICLVGMLFCSSLQAQAQFSIRAASEEAVPGTSGLPVPSGEPRLSCILCV